MTTDNAATVDGRAGLLRTRPDGSLVWEAELEGDAVATLVRRAMIHGGLACLIDGVRSTVCIQCLYYDAGSRRLVAELAGTPSPLS